MATPTRAACRRIPLSAHSKEVDLVNQLCDAIRRWRPMPHAGNLQRGERRRRVRQSSNQQLARRTLLPLIEHGLMPREHRTHLNEQVGQQSTRVAAGKLFDRAIYRCAERYLWREQQTTHVDVGEGPKFREDRKPELNITLTSLTIILTSRLITLTSLAITLTSLAITVTSSCWS